MPSGGKRQGAGRKSASDKKKEIKIWVKESVINHFGKDKIKEDLRNFCQEKYKKDEY